MFSILFWLISGFLALYPLDGIHYFISSKRGDLRRFNWLNLSTKEDSVMLFIVIVLTATNSILGYKGFANELTSHGLSEIDLDAQAWLMGQAIYLSVCFSLPSKIARGWQWLKSKVSGLKQARIAQQTKLRELAGTDIAKDFRDLQKALLNEIGDSQMSILGDRIKYIIEKELPHSLTLRRYLIDAVPRAKAALDRVGTGGGMVDIELSASRDAYNAVVQRQSALQAHLTKLRHTLELLLPRIMHARSGLISEQALATSSLQEINSLVEAIQAAVTSETAPVVDPPEVIAELEAMRRREKVGS